MVPNEGVRSSLVTDGGQRSVPRMHHRRGVERPKLRMDGVGEQVKITTGVFDIGSSNRTSKQGITNKHMIGSILNRKKEATSPECVPRCVENAQFEASKIV